MDKAWVWLPRASLEYEQGATKFVYESKRLLGNVGQMLCPCIHCRNVCHQSVGTVLDHLVINGMDQKYKRNSKFGHMKKGQSHMEASPICDKLVFSKVKQGLGGNVRIILSGAAPLASHVESFLRVVACCHVLQGYGLTESCAGTFVSLPDELDMLGTVGPPVPNVDIRLEY